MSEVRQDPQADENAPWIDRYRREARREFASLRLPDLSAVAAAVIAAATLVVVMGGTVLWIRAGNADLPQAETLAVMPRELFAVVGARELALPILFWTVFNMALRPVSAIAQRRREERHSDRKLQNRKDWIVTAFRTLALVFFLTSPLDWSTAWLVVVLLGFSYVIDHEIALPLGGILIVSAILASGSALTAEADAPVQLREATVETRSNVPTPTQPACTSPRPQQACTSVSTVTSSPVPARDVRQVSIGDPPESDDDEPPSLTDRARDLIGDLF